MDAQRTSTEAPVCWVEFSWWPFGAFSIRRHFEGCSSRTPLLTRWAAPLYRPLLWDPFPIWPWSLALPATPWWADTSVARDAIGLCGRWKGVGFTCWRDGARS